MLNKRLKNLISLYRFHFKNLALDLGIQEGHLDYCRFIILGRARSGSNFLRSLLNAHSQIVTFGELFRSYDSIGWEFPDHDQYLQYQSLISLMQSNPVGFLEKKVFRKFPKRILAVGFKLFYYHAQDNSRKAVWPYLKDQKDLKIIHLTRINTLKLILSLKKAFKSNRWTDIAGQGQEEDFVVSLDYKECLHEFTWSEEVKKQYDIYFEDSPKIDVFYENLSKNYNDEIRRVQEFLGINYEVARPSTYQQSKQPLSKSISNYFELKEKFKRTPWEKFFED
ncbi:MAG: sulfotransferase domain-containing protein [Planctomycetia bacterium]|nr:sulfotransferase domain-containing protein [Planctomycetia bacterium]